MRRWLGLWGIVGILSGCQAVLPPVVLEDGSVIRYCNDPLLEAGQPCTTDDRGVLVGVAIGAIVFISWSTYALQTIVRKQNKRG